ncbi:MAG: hypothetical protein M3Z05_03155 [Gemmatimonadota bacterium]|nr:hypothetical protein [Gemmatimonadota bacterium]
MADDVAFLISPARCDGRRAQVLMNPSASFDLARNLRGDAGAPIGEVFSFLSGLYFRGKLSYARALTPTQREASHIRIITTERGLIPPTEHVKRDDLVAFGDVDIANGDARYLMPLRRDAELLARKLPSTTGVVLLGSIATGKYVDTLLEVFGDRLLFPAAFVGRGDMSRGGLLLRHAQSGMPLDYIPVAGAVRRGKRPPKLAPIGREK